MAEIDGYHPAHMKSAEMRQEIRVRAGAEPSSRWKQAQSLRLSRARGPRSAELRRARPHGQE